MSNLLPKNGEIFKTRFAEFFEKKNIMAQIPKVRDVGVCWPIKKIITLFK